MRRIHSDPFAAALLHGEVKRAAFIPTALGAVAGGVGGVMTADDDATTKDKIVRGGIGAIIGGGIGYGAGALHKKLTAKPAVPSGAAAAPTAAGAAQAARPPPPPPPAPPPPPPPPPPPLAPRGSARPRYQPQTLLESLN